LVSEYREELLAFLQSVDWDAEDYVKLQALSIAGEYLRGHQDREILKIVYDIYGNPEERGLIRAAAYIALCRSAGAEWRDIVPAPGFVDSSTEVDREILRRVEQKLKVSSN
jgi:hypothetical protein